MKRGAYLSLICTALLGGCDLGRVGPTEPVTMDYLATDNGVAVPVHKENYPPRVSIGMDHQPVIPSSVKFSALALEGEGGAMAREIPVSYVWERGADFDWVSHFVWDGQHVAVTPCFEISNAAFDQDKCSGSSGPFRLMQLTPRSGALKYDGRDLLVAGCRIDIGAVMGKATPENNDLAVVPHATGVYLYLRNSDRITMAACGGRSSGFSLSAIGDAAGIFTDEYKRNSFQILDIVPGEAPEKPCVLIFWRNFEGDALKEHRAVVNFGTGTLTAVRGEFSVLTRPTFWKRRCDKILAELDAPPDVREIRATIIDIPTGQRERLIWRYAITSI